MACGLLPFWQSFFIILILEYFQEDFPESIYFSLYQVS